MKKRIFIVAGEASGDMHAAALIRQVLKKDDSIEFRGIGGQHMIEAGAEIIVDSARLAVVGIVEIIKHWDDISGALKAARATLVSEKPDLLILVDYPEFNLRLAKTAKQLGIPVLFYISPQVWAWRQKRVHLISKRIDMMAVVFPFEAEFYRKHGVPVKFVGHPLMEEYSPCENQSQLREELGLSTNKPVVTLMPGSRKSELKRLLPVMLGSVLELKSRNQSIQFVLPVASTLTIEDVHGYAGENSPCLDDILLLPRRSKLAICVSDVVITASGTATLEIGLLQKPMVVVYRISKITYAIVSRLLKIPYIALSNIVAGEKISPELLQEDANPVKIADEVQRMLDNNDYRVKTSNQLAKIKEKLGSENIEERIEDVVLNILEKRNKII